MILLIDNYDSFSYNVYQLVGSVNSDIKVIRNDEMTVEEIEALAPGHIILSPGPGRPADAGVCEEVLRRLAGKIPMLGICLGHQAICEVFGADITYAKELMHGKQSVARLDNDSALFKGMAQELVVARYHSLAADPDTMPDCLKITARTADGEIMAVEHREYPIYGVQFHPESVLTPEGRAILKNFLLGDAAADDRKQTDISQNGTDMQKDKTHTKKECVQMIQEAIVRLSKGEDIGYETAKTVMDEIMSGEASDVHKSAYLTALSMKGETIEEITGSAEEMRAHALKLDADADVLEIVGTGGDGSNSFNISTTSAIVIAAAGVPV
ncbi:MAG: gamma-glutamyl-gamma-aminobutyrate hydrolase family protein, partial [Acetatifactor sp.]|nr:gamma-glutamyl-gamma-aminobutyrate hydrolase family protein [Acetatifactor sp.]